MSTIAGWEGREENTSTVFTTTLGSRLGWGWGNMASPLIAHQPMTGSEQH